MLRIGLFLLTNLAIMVLISAIFQLFGLQGILQENGVDLNLGALLLMCAIFGIAGSMISLLLSKTMAKRAMGVQIIDQPANQNERWLQATVTDLAAKAGIKTPEIGIFPSPACNAFATGWKRNDALVAVSEGLLQRMTRDEAAAVLGHEIGHVANGDMITLSLVQGVVNTFVMFFAYIIGNFVDRVIFKTERGHGIGFFITNIFAQMVLGLLASVIVMWFSRWREFRADAAGASLTNRDSMVAALQRLQREQDIPKDMPDEMVAFGISGDIKDKVSKLFMTHPPLTERIAALQAQQA